MELQLVRYCYGPDHVAGLLKFSDQSLWALECPWRENQVFSSCIPDGTYPLVAFESPEHPLCWVVTPVPGRTGVLIHVGNTVADTQGCILIGQFQEPGKVLNSRDALRQLNYTLNRNEQHVLHIGAGMGAVLVHDRPSSELPSGGNGGESESELRVERGEGTDRTPNSPGGTD